MRYVVGFDLKINPRLIIVGAFIALFNSACSIHTGITSLSEMSTESTVHPSVPAPALNPLFITSSKTSSSVEDNDLSFSGSGGHPPFSFSLLQGLGSLAANSQTYTPVGLQKETIKVQVTDSAGQVAEKTMTISGFESMSVWNPSVAAHHTGIIPMQVITATNTWVVKDETSFHISSDGGVTWINRPLSIDVKNSRVFAVDPVRSFIYLAGVAAYVWKVYKSTDLGITWSLIDAHGNGVDTSGTNRPKTIFVHPTSGLLFVAGQSVPVANMAFSSYGKAYVRRSADFGVTWTESDFVSELGPASGYWGSAEIMTMGPDGSLYHAGSVPWGTDTTGATCICNRSYVRKSTDSGLTWTTLTPFMRSSGYGFGTSVYNLVLALSVSPTNVITVAAEEQNSITGEHHFYFRQSSDGGVTWSAGTDALASGGYGYTLDPFTSEIYRYKLLPITATTSSWTIDKSTNLGSSYTNVENYSENVNSTTLNKPNSLFFDSTDIYVSGVIYDIGKLSIGLIRKYPRSGVPINFARFSGGSADQSGSVSSILATNTGYDLGGAWGGAQKIGVGKFTSSSSSLVEDEYYSFTNTEFSYSVNELAILNGNTYIAAKTNDTASIWLVRQRNDTTGVWSPKDSYSKAAGYNAKAMSIVKAGTRYITCGYAKDSTTSYFTIRTSASNDDTSWSTTLETPDASGFSEHGCLKLGVNPLNGDVYAVGSRPTGVSNSLEWYIYRSTDSGVTWTQLDRFNFGIGFHNLTDIAFRSTGEIFITTTSGVVRSSINNGTTWSNEIVATGSASSIFIDSANTMWVTLNTQAGRGSVYRKIVGGSWQEYYFKTGANFADFIILADGTKAIVGSNGKPLLIEFRK